MTNPMQYIKNLEAAGFERNQAEAQVQMVLEAIEGDLVRKSDFAVFQAQMKRDFDVFKEGVHHEFVLGWERLENRLEHWQRQAHGRIDSRFDRWNTRFQNIDDRFDGLDDRIDAIDVRLNTIDTRLDTIDHRFSAVDTRFDAVDVKFNQLETHIDERLDERFAENDRRLDHRLLSLEFRLMTRLGLLMVSSLSIAVAVLAWLSKA